MFKNNISREFFLVYLFSYLSAPLSYFVKIIYAKNLSVEEFGLIYSIIGFFGIISIFNDLGMSETLNYFGVKFYERGKWLELKISFYYALFMQTLTAIFISIIIFFLSDFLLEKFFKVEPTNILLFFLLYFIFINLTKPIRIIFNVSKKYSYNNIFNFFNYFLLIIFTSCFLFFEISFYLIGIVFSLPIIILCIIYLYIIFSKDFCMFKTHKFKFDFDLYKKILRYALGVVIGSCALVLLSKIDIMFILYFLGVSEVGFYEIALSLASIIALILSPILSTIFPITTSFIEEKKLKDLNLLVNEIYKVFIILGVPFSLVFSQFPSEIVIFLFGLDYIESSLPLSILCFGILFSLFQSLNFSILAGLGKVKQRNYIIYISAFLNIILNYILIKNYGLIGAAISTSIVFIFMFLSSAILNNSYGIKFKIKLLEILKITLSNIIFFIVLYILKLNLFFDFNLTIFYFDFSIVLKLIVICLISFSIYFILLYVLKVLDIKSIKNFLKN